jgi:hypothetical protein
LNGRDHPGRLLPSIAYMVTDNMIKQACTMLQQAARRSAFLFLVCLLALTPALTTQAWAQPPIPAYDPEADEDAEPGPVDQRTALARVRARFPGNVISINEDVGERGEARFRVRLDNQGNVYTVYVNQATGRVSRE